jgi:hypothetical protein
MRAQKKKGGWVGYLRFLNARAFLRGLEVGNLVCTILYCWRNLVSLRVMETRFYYNPRVKMDILE